MNNLKEDEQNEFKEVLNSKLEKEVIGFLNTNGGNIYIGIDDSGNPIGINADIDKIQLEIKDRIKNNINPSTIGLFEIKIKKIKSIEIIQIIIAAGNQRPYHLRNKGMISEGCFLRVGSSTETMPAQMVLSMFSNRTRDNIRNILSPIQELTFSQLKIYYEEKGFEVNNNFYKHIHILMPDGSYNYLGYLLSDNNNISIKVAIYNSEIADDLVEVEEFGNCSIIKAAQNVLNKLQIFNKTYTKITSTKRLERKLINPIALREATINAIVHTAWENEISPKFEIFNNRISISSSGGLPHNISEDEFLKGFSAPRNPEIMKVFSDLDLVEQLGTGIIRILKYYDKSIFELFPNFIRVNFPIENYAGINKEIKSTETKKGNLTLRELEIVRLIKSNPHITQEEIANMYGLNIRTIKRDFSKLIQEEIIKREGDNINGKWIVS